MPNYPAISCFCSVYGKVHCLHELVYSFLNQDYKGPKELVILNDLADQNIVFNHPEVKIINVKEHLSPLGRKFNTNISYCKYDIISVMEVDDIYLPNHLTYAIDNMKNGMYHCGNAWVWTGTNIPLHHAGNYFHATHCYTMDLFNQVCGYSEIIDNTTLDIDIIVKFQKILGNYSQSQKFEDISYIYRWGVGGYHASGWGSNINNLSQLAQSAIEQRIHSKEEPTGEILINPEWKEDYLTLAREAVLKYAST
jgi:hypothetical protein